MARKKQSAEEVFHLLKRAAYFSIFSVPDPEQLSQGVPLIPFGNLLYRIDITESPRRHQIAVGSPTPDCGFRSNMIGSDERIAKQHLVLDMMPNNYEAGFGRTPPPTLLIPFLSQRFYMSQGEFDFLDPEHSGFRAHAAGRFFPATSAGKVYLRIGVVVEMLKYLGRLEGLVGNLVVNGYTTPPQIFANNFIIRFVDPAGTLISDSPLPPVQNPVQNPEPDASFIPLMAELHPDYPIVVSTSNDGKKRKFSFVERLRLVDSSFVVKPVLKSRTVERQIVGEHRITLVFDPTDPNEVIPLYSLNSEFRFFADGNKPIGSLTANLFEGRAFRTYLTELDEPFFRITGFGPFISGTGQFDKVVGMVSVNGALSLDPEALSAMYMLRMADPLGRFRVPWERA